MIIMSEGSSGLVFNISLSQCVKNDRERRQPGDEDPTGTTINTGAPLTSSSWVTTTTTTDDISRGEGLQRQHSNLPSHDEVKTILKSWASKLLSLYN